MVAAAAKSMVESRKRVSVTPKLRGRQPGRPVLRLRSATSFSTPPLPAAEDLLVSRQPFTRGANQRAAFALPSPSAPRRKDPVGSAPPLPAPRSPGRAGLGAGVGAGVDRGGVARPYKNGGGGGKNAHSVPLLGGCSDRAAPAGGCPRQGPTSVVSSSAAQVSPWPPPLKVRGRGGPREPRAPPSGGSVPAERSSQVFPELGGGAGAGGEVQTGAGPLRLLRQHTSPAPPPREDQSRRPERELQLSRDFGRGLANFGEFLLRASRGWGGRRAGDGALQLRPGPTAPPPPPPPPPRLRSRGHARRRRPAEREFERGGFGRRS